MPNWCVNKLKISGEEAVRTTFLSDCTGFPATAIDNLVMGSVSGAGKDLRHCVKSSIMTSLETAFKMNNTIPMPSELENTQSPTPREDKDASRRSLLYGHANWYGWRVANWGTKWDVSHVQVRDNGCEMEVHFLTPWGPPWRWIETISANYEAVFSVHYYDPYRQTRWATVGGG